MLIGSHKGKGENKMDRTIRIDDRFDLHYDEMGDKWLVEKGISKKSGKATQKVYCGYHWHFDNLLKSFCKKRLPEYDATSVKGALRAMSETEADMQALADRIGKALDEKWK